MATVIKSMNDLSGIIESRIQQALKMTQQEIFNVFQEHITDYYKEPVFRNGTSAIPMMYDRTYKLLNSLIKTDIVKSGGTISCTVEIDPNYLNYKYMGGVSGLDVMLSANEQFHGWSIEGDIRIWDDAMAELGLKPGILYLMKNNLKKCGVPVK
ncbi:MAG: hypothetical protein K2N51_08090 [Lachnospiraceae bacterium]|nr:hypothetical protein [Lachnospiraceae bacterium]